jgi:hypothetical protein
LSKQIEADCRVPLSQNQLFPTVLSPENAYNFWLLYETLVKHKKLPDGVTKQEQNNHKSYCDLTAATVYTKSMMQPFHTPR